MSPNQATPRNLRDVLRLRQQATRPGSCDPCRERKVGCDRGHPCKTCAKRGYPDLCIYTPTAQGRRGTRGNTGNTTSRRSVTVQNTSHHDQATTPGPSPTADGWEPNKATPRPTPGSSLGARISPHDPGPLTAGRSNLDPEVRVPNHSTVASSLYVPLPQNRDDADLTSAFELGISPLLGAHGRDTDSFGTSGAWAETLDVLSVDRGLFDIFQSYCRNVHPFHATPLDLEYIENKFCLLLNIHDSNRDKIEAELVRDPEWLCLLNAMLAAGAQASELPLEQRATMSRRHTKLAFKGLNSTNYIYEPYKEAIQALLLIGNVMQNDMKPQAAWALWGSTVRLAQCIGVHKNGRSASSAPMSRTDALHLRLAIVWQDSLLSLAFGRPTTSGELNHKEDLLYLRGEAEPQAPLSYRESMYWLCHHVAHYLHYSPLQNQPPYELSACLKDLDSMTELIAPHLMVRQSCKSIREIQEHYAFELHKNFAISTICRPYVSGGAIGRAQTEQSRAVIVARLEDALTRSAEAYLKMRSVSGYASRSWAFIHNGLASVLLLSLMKRTRNKGTTRDLQSKIIDSLEQEELSMGSNVDSANSNFLTETHGKALRALKALRGFSENNRQISVDVPEPETLESSSQQPGAFPVAQADQPSVDNYFTFPNDSDMDLDMDQLLSTFNFDQYPVDAFDMIMAEPFN